MTRLVVALGGGGGAGIGHIPVLQALDDLKLRPDAIIGVSAGSLIGASYASGISADALHAHVADLARSRTQTLLKAFRPSGIVPGSGLDPTGVVDALLPDGVPETFAGLQIPLQVGVTDIRARKPRVLGTGDLRSAVAASIAIPGLFRAVEREGLLLFDGGVTDNLGLAALPPADLTLAVDAATEPSDVPFTARGGPGASIVAMRIMMERMAQDNLDRHQPDILIRARQKPVKITDFWRAERLMAEMAPLRQEAREKLEAAVDRLPKLSPAP